MNELKTYIEMLIKQQSEKDAEFKALLSKPNKSVEECAKFLQGEAYKEAKKGKGTCRCVRWSDETMTGQIIHYYQEDNIKTEQLPEEVKTEPKKAEPAKAVKLKRKVTIKKKSSNCQELSLF